MANLRVNKITGTEVFETTGSVQFDGSTGYLSLADSEDYNFGSGDFTVEGWMYLIGNGEAYLLGQASSTGANSSGCVAVLSDSSNNLVARVFQSSGSYNELTHSVISKAVWNHFALVRSGSTLFLYLNGVSVQISIGSITLNNSTNQLGIGRLGEYASKYFNGHISNFRILKGTALYTSNFTPPTRELTVIPNTVLLCCQSTTRANEERTGKTITVNGNAVANELTPGLLTDRVKSGGSSAISGSVEFDGSGDYLTAGTSNDYIFGTGDYTLECWAYFQTLNSENSLISNHNADANWTWKVVSNKLRIYTGSTDVDGTSTITTGAWYHFAVTRQSSTLKLFVNGINETTTTSSNNYTINNTLHIGAQQNNLAATYINGFISNLRVIKGTALYTQNFIPPTRELKKIPGTVLLCCQDSTNPLQEATGKTISLNGSVTSYSVGIGTTTPNPRNFTPSVGFDGTVIFDGVTKINSPNYFYLPTGNTERRDFSAGVRGVFSAGYQAPATPSATNVIDYVNIASTGNAQDFGDLLTAKWGVASCSSSTRGLIGGGLYPGVQGVNTIDYITINSTGNAQDFGDLTDSRRGLVSCSSPTRGIFAGGYVTSPTLILSNIIEYVTISSTGNAQDFGDTTFGGGYKSGFSSPTRGVMGGDYLYATPTTHNNVIDYIIISSTGNAQDFGDLTQNKSSMGAFSNSIRGLFGGGFTPATNLNTIDYVTIATTGNAQDFGDLIESKFAVAGTSSQIRGIFGGGSVSTNVIQYVSIMSTGNTIDFGDLTVARGYFDACSNGHGGLG